MKTKVLASVALAFLCGTAIAQPLRFGASVQTQQCLRGNLGPGRFPSCDEHPTGLLVVSLIPDGPAFKAGLLVGDVIVSFNDKPNYTDIKVDIVRAGRHLIIDIPADPQAVKTHEDQLEAEVQAKARAEAEAEKAQAERLEVAQQTIQQLGQEGLFDKVTALVNDYISKEGTSLQRQERQIASLKQLPSIEIPADTKVTGWRCTVTNVSPDTIECDFHSVPFVLHIDNSKNLEKLNIGDTISFDGTVVVGNGCGAPDEQGTIQQLNNWAFLLNMLKRTNGQNDTNESFLPMPCFLFPQGFKITSWQSV